MADPTRLPAAEEQPFGALIDPEFPRFQKRRGRIVETDADGRDAPVPFATVAVYDIDFGLLAWSPVDSPHAWFYPFSIRHEQLATVGTDACGRFCVWAPRADTDPFDGWRRERPWPRSGPNADPGPPRGDDSVLSRAARLVDARALAELQEMLRVVRPRARTRQQGPARPARPSRPREAAGALVPAVRARLAARIGLPAELLSGFDPLRAHGPFLRSRQRPVPEWSTILDAPGLGFEVTRDVADDDARLAVRWDAQAIDE